VSPSATGALGLGRSLWLAGLGLCGLASDLLSTATDRGAVLVDRLVERGQPLEARRRAAFKAAARRTAEIADGTRELLVDTAAYESRQAMRRLRVAGLDDFRALGVRIDTLSSRIDEMARR
jgi:hypothetical protein